MKNWWQAFAAVAPALILFLNFHNRDSVGLYGGYLDSFQYVSVGKQLLRTLEHSSSAYDSLIAIFETRVPKASIISHVVAFFLLVSGQDHSQAYYLYNLTFLSLFLVYLYLIFSLCLSPWIGVAATILISTLPWFLNLALTLDTHLAFMAVTMVVIFHMIKSDGFTKRSHSLIFGVTFSFCACLRPLETVSIFGLPLFLYLLCYVIRRKFWARSAFVFLFPFMVTLVAGYVATREPFRYPNSIYLLLLVVPFLLLPLIFYRACGLPKNLSFAYVLFAVPPTVWWLPYSAALSNWVALGAGRGRPHYFDSAHIPYLIYSFQLFVGIGFVFLFCLWAARRYTAYNIKDLQEKLLTVVFLYLVFGPALMVSTLRSHEPSYLRFVFIYIWVVLLILALRNLRSWIVVTTVLCLLAANQTSFILSLMRGEDRKDAFVSLIHFKQINYLLDFRPAEVNPGPIYFENLRELISKRTVGQKTIRIDVVYRRTLSSTRLRHYVFDFISSNEKNLPLRTRSFEEEYLKVLACEKNLACLKSRFSATDYFMIETFGGEDASKYFKQETTCRLESLGVINPIFSERNWAGYSVFKRICDAG